MLVLGLFESVIVLMVADLSWNVARTVIDRKLASVATDGQLTLAEVGHRARLRTLLSIFRNGFAALVLAITALTALAELGIEVGLLSLERVYSAWRSVLDRKRWSRT